MLLTYIIKKNINHLCLIVNHIMDIFFLKCFNFKNLFGKISVFNDYNPNGNFNMSCRILIYGTKEVGLQKNSNELGN